MDATFSATALRDHPREVKQAARERLVRITENGNGAYVFCSEEVVNVLGIVRQRAVR